MLRLFFDETFILEQDWMRRGLCPCSNRLGLFKILKRTEPSIFDTVNDSHEVSFVKQVVSILVLRNWSSVVIHGCTLAPL
jgi:hypothetical protein